MSEQKEVKTSGAEVNPLQEFEKTLVKERPSQVAITWEGVFSSEECANVLCTALVHRYYSIITAEFNDHKFELSIPSGAIASASPDGFEDILVKYGYELVDKWGATGSWTYLYQLPEGVDE